MQELEQFRKRVEGRRKKPTSLANRLTDINCFERWCEEEGIESPGDIGVNEIEDYLAYLGREDYSGAVVNSRWWTLKIFFGDLVKRGEIEENPLKDFDKRPYSDLFNGSKKAEYVDARGGIFALQEEGVHELAENVPKPTLRNKLVVLLSYHTGVRRQELADMKLKNVDRNKREILVYSKKKDSSFTKDTTDPWRSVWYGPSLDPLMDRWIEVERKGYSTADSPYLFTTYKSERLSEDQIGEIVRKAAENAGIQEVMYVDLKGHERNLITHHTLRHSFARACMTPDEAGNRIDVKRLAELMGHEDSSMTAEKYLHFAEDDIKQARELYGPR